MSRRLPALAAVFALSGVGRAYPEFRANTYTTSSQDLPAVAATPDGGFVAAWMSLDAELPGSDVYARRWQTLAGPISPALRVNSYTTSHQWRPAVASDGNGGFVVVWESRDQDGSDYGIFAQRFDASGTRIGGEFRVNSYTTQRQARPDVAADASGGFVVVWQGSGHGDGNGIFARRFDPPANPLGPDFRVNTWTTGTQHEPTVAMAASGNFVIAYSGGGQPPDGSNFGVFARRFDAAGQARGSEFLVNSTTTQRQAAPDLAMDSSGHFVVVWEGFDPWFPGAGCEYLGPDCTIFGRAYEPDGTARGLEFRIARGGNTRYPAVALGATGQFVVAWEVNDQGGRGVYARQFEEFGATGALGSMPGYLNEYFTGDQRAVALAMLPGGQCVALWSSDGQDGSAEGVFGHVDFMDLIFEDGFEDHDLDFGSPWTALATDGDDLAVSPAAALNGTGRGLRAVVDDTAGLWVQDDSPLGESDYHASFFFDTNGFDPGEALNHRRVRLFVAFEGDPDEGVRRVIAIVLRRVAGAYAVRGRVLTQEGHRLETTWVPVSDGAHSVELSWHRSSNPDVPGGMFSMWVDGDSATGLNVPNYYTTIDFARLGALSVKAGGSGILYFDEFESRRVNRTGP